jgi:hypothetical protein
MLFPSGAASKYSLKISHLKLPQQEAMAAVALRMILERLRRTILRGHRPESAFS